MTTAHGASFLFIELGLVLVGIAVLARVGSRWGFSAIPLYLLAGLAFGNGGLAPLRLSENFVRIGAVRPGEGPGGTVSATISVNRSTPVQFVPGVSQVHWVKEGLMIAVDSISGTAQVRPPLFF